MDWEAKEARTKEGEAPEGDASRPSVAVSACLLGERCTWRGGSNALPPDTLARLNEAYRIVPICPEVQGGLPTPRPPAEIINGRVVAKTGEDVTERFEAGARAALADARAAGCRFALLKERSPSCGFGCIYDGTFSGALVQGSGVAALMFADAGICVFGDGDVAALLAELENRP